MLLVWRLRLLYLLLMLELLVHLLLLGLLELHLLLLKVEHHVDVLLKERLLRHQLFRHAGVGGLL